jgi:hypothetical protein
VPGGFNGANVSTSRMSVANMSGGSVGEFRTERLNLESLRMSSIA